MDTKSFKPKHMRLHLPEDIYKFLLRVQAIQKQECGCQFSLQSTVYKLLRQLKLDYEGWQRDKEHLKILEQEHKTRGKSGPGNETWEFS